MRRVLHQTGRRPGDDQPPPAKPLVLLGRLFFIHNLDRAVVVAVVTMRMVQPAVNQIIHMITMRHRRVAAVRPVHMPILVLALQRMTAVRVLIGHRQDVLIHMVLVRMMKVTVMQIVYVTIMPDRRMPAARPVLMRVRPLMNMMF